MTLHGVGSQRLLIALVVLVLAAPAWAQQAPQQSTTGPAPPPGVVSAPLSGAKSIAMIEGVPAYEWRHGCGPTAVGMVIGYYDAHGYDDLIPGDASTQTDAVDQVIASGGSLFTGPVTPERHFEDYAVPIDFNPPAQTDNCIVEGRPPHTDDCLADFMETSRSTENNCYGWSWSSDIRPAFQDYVAYVDPASRYTPTALPYHWTMMSFDLLKTEIDNGRPMVFLVDSSGDGSTDHFVPIIGYDDGPPQSYIYYDTWDLDPHQAEFREMSDSYEWGVWGGWTFQLEGGSFYFARLPQGGTFGLGDALELWVEAGNAQGDVTYQWSKDSADLPGETHYVYEVASLAKADEGWYSCRVTDESKAVYQTPPVFVQVAEVPVPAAGCLALSVSVAALLGLGRRAVRRRRE